MRPLGGVLLLAAAAHGYGVTIAAALRLPLASRLERAAVGVGLGAGALLLLTFVLGLLHLVGRGTALALTVPAALYGVARALPWVGRTGHAAVGPRGLRLALAAVLVVCAVANLLGTLAPPSFVDALVYHLFIPRTYLQAGGIVEIPAIWQSYQPVGVEMLFTLGFALQGELLAALIHTSLGVLAAAGTALIGRRVAGPTGGLLAAAVFYCTAMIAWESTSCFVELGITAFAVLAFYALLRWSDDEQPRWLATAAFFTGLAGSCKLTAIQFAVVASALVAWISWRRGRGPIVALGRAAALGGIAVGLCVPWYVHAYSWIGNPVYPFAPKIFGANVDYETVWSILHQYGPGHTVRDLLLAPWRLFSEGALFEGGQYLSPLPLVFGPVILLRLRRSLDRQVVFAACGIGFLLWLSSAHIARYLIPLQPLLAVLAADAMLATAAGSRYRARLVAVAGALFIGFGAVTTVAGLKNVAPVLLGRESADAYLTRTALFYPAYRQVMRDVPPGGLILTNLGPTYYLERPHVRVRNSEILAGREHLSNLIDQRPFTHIFLHGQPGLEEAVLALGPRVTMVWHREIDVPLSRTFGGSRKSPASLFQIVR